MNTKQNKVANLLPNLSIDNCVLTLEANAKTSVAVAAAGKRLVKRVASEGMDEAMAASCADYVAACNGEVKRLNIGRKPFTGALTEIQKKFVKIEKDIDPQVSGSPAYEIIGLLKSYKLFLNDTLFVTATCDSLQQLVYDYQQQVERLSTCAEREEKTKERGGGRLLFWVILLVVAAYLAGRLR